MSGLRVDEAARAAKQYVTEALRAATPMGKGGGSMDHLHAAFRTASGASFRVPAPSYQEESPCDVGDARLAPEASQRGEL